MNILVCAKQVPNTPKITINPKTNTLDRRGVLSMQNPTDICALGMALDLRESIGAHVGMVTMGPEQAVKILKDALSLGVKKACLVSDAAFAGSDTYATSSILAAAIRHIEKTFPPDLILCGKQSLDGETGQVGPELAEMLNVPQITNATEFRIENGRVMAKQMAESGFRWLSAPLPALVTVNDHNGLPLFRPGKPDAVPEIEHIGKDLLLEIDPDCAMGLSDSQTRVIRAFVPSSARRNIPVDGKTASDKAGQLLKMLRADGIF